MVMSDRGRPHPAPRADRAKSGRRRPVRSQARRRSQRVSYLQVSCAPSGNPTRSEAFMSERVQVGDLRVAKVLYDFVEEEALPGTGVSTGGLLGRRRQASSPTSRPRNRELLAARDELQAQHRRLAPRAPRPPARPGGLQGVPAARSATSSTSRPTSRSTTADVDDEIARIAGPQLVVPVLNARFALNAANARWGSLYDALYGTDAIPEDERRRSAARPTTRCAAPRSSPAAAAFLDDAFPLGRRLARRRDRLRRRRTARCRSTCRRTAPSPASPTPAPVRRLPRRRRGARGGAAGPPRPARRDRDRPRSTRSARPTPPASKDVRARVRGHHDHGPRGLGRRGRRRRQGARLPQLARADEGHLAEEVTKGGKTFTRATEPRPHLHGRRTAATVDAAGPRRCCSSATSAT